MGLQFRDTAAALQAGVSIQGRDASNVLRTFNAVNFRDEANVLHMGGFTSMTAGVSPSTAEGTVWSFGGSLTVTSNVVTASVLGGTPTYTYAWARISGSASITATSAATAHTAFTASVSCGDELTADFTCTITDANGATATVTITVTLNHVDLN